MDDDLLAAGLCKGGFAGLRVPWSVFGARPITHNVQRLLLHSAAGGGRGEWDFSGGGLYGK